MAMLEKRLAERLVVENGRAKDELRGVYWISLQSASGPRKIGLLELFDNDAGNDPARCPVLF